MPLLTLFFRAHTMLTQFLIHDISLQVLNINFIYIRHLNYLFHNVPFVNIPYYEDRDMFAFFFFLKRSLTSESLFLLFSFEPSRSTANHRLKSHFFSLLWWAEWRKIIHEKYLFFQKLFRRSPQCGVVLLGLGERRNERKLRISLTWLFFSSSWFLLSINAKREKLLSCYHINYSTTQRLFSSSSSVMYSTTQRRHSKNSISAARGEIHCQGKVLCIFTLWSRVVDERTRCEEWEGKLCCSTFLWLWSWLSAHTRFHDDF